VAGHLAALDIAERRFFRRAHVLDERAPRAEAAAARHVARVWRLARKIEVERDRRPPMRGTAASSERV
jgi:hypothetical protein